MPLYMKYGVFGEVDLREASIRGQLDMDHAKVTNPKATGWVWFGNAKVTGDLLMWDSTIDRLFMGSLAVDGGVYMTDSTVESVDLHLAKIGGPLNMQGLKFASLYLPQIQVGSDLSVKSIHVRGAPDRMKSRSELRVVDLRSAKIDGNLDLSNSVLRSLDLTGAQIRRVLILGSVQRNPPSLAPTWLPGAKFTLLNTEVGGLQDLPEAWPNELELDGFSYALGGTDPDNAVAMLGRDISLFTGWLRRQTHYSPQPYERLASLP
jgi:hypothetical protein